MHELAVTTHLLELSLDHAKTVQAMRISDLYLVVGQLSSMIDDSVQFYWEIVSENTIAAGSKLHFRRVPAEMQCSDCQQRYPLNMDDLACPHCGSLSGKIVSGDEFYLDSIAVEGVEESQITEEAK